MSFRVLPRARRDLESIRTYIASENPQAAQKVAAALVKSFGLLSRNPEIGRPSEAGGIREWSVPGLPYLIPYRIKDGSIEILRVFHASRDRPQSWS